VGLFNKRSAGGASNADRTTTRTGNCIYLGEPFPKRGERISISAIEVDFALDPPDVPGTWTEIADFVRSRTREPREHRVLVNILGTTLGMVELKLVHLGEALGIEPEVVSGRRAYLRRGGNSVSETSAPFLAQPNGSQYWNFEIIKIISLMSGSGSGQMRAQLGWPYPEIWGGDSSLSLPILTAVGHHRHVLDPVPLQFVGENVILAPIRESLLKLTASALIADAA
jgi:hypothetical protein